MLVEPFNFNPVQRRALSACLSKAGVAEAAIAEIEQAVETLRVLLESRGPTRQTAESLRRLAEASERFVTKGVGGLDDDGRDLIAQTVARLGYSAGFLVSLAEGHRILGRALDRLNRDRATLVARAGAPRKVARAWLLDELREILSRHHRPSRRKVFEAIARQGLKAPARASALPVAQCAASVLRAVGQRSPQTLDKIVRRVKNLPRNT